VSDYMFMLENHLTADQASALSEVRNAAQAAGLSLFLTGGAIRDMIGGFPIRDLDLTIEGDPVKLIKEMVRSGGATLSSMDENRKLAELVFRGGVTVEIGMARQERTAKIGGKPQVTPAAIYEDLRGRDFTINALALSLNRASKGLLIDPLNGLGDLEQKELRAGGNYAFYNSPVRLLRLFRLQVRLGYAIAERTQSQYANAREAHVEKHISARALRRELRAIANEPNPLDVLQALDREGLLTLFSPSMTMANLNTAGLTKVQKSRTLLPFGVDLRINWLALMLGLGTDKWTPKERAALATQLGMKDEESEPWLKIEARAKKLEKSLQSSSLNRPSSIYDVISKADGELILFLLSRSTERLVVDRLKNYLQRYALTAAEVTDAAVREAIPGIEAGTPKWNKKRQELIATKLDARPKRVPPVIAPPEPAPAAVPNRRVSPSAR
jgi:tRNA nucleotidyltransferase (CCA-adding enzyme)